MRGIITITLMTLMIGVAVIPAQAGIAPQVGDRMYFSDYIKGQKGGSLLANPTGGSGFTAFRTFCIEIEEHVWVGGGSDFQYEIASIGYQTVNGGKTLTEETAWLYTEYTESRLGSYNDSLVADRNAMQYGIWHSMGYTDQELLNNLGSGFQTVIDDYNNNRSWASDYANSGWSGFGDVHIANLIWGNTHQGHDYGYNAQDQLIRTPPMVPAPGAGMLGVIGLSLVGWCKRRFG